MTFCKPLFILGAICSLNAVAQDKERITVKAGSDVNEVLADKMYQYSQFVDGVVTYKNGNSSAGKLNYNRLYATIDFLTEEGDTLVLAEEKTIRCISLQGNDTFVFDKVYLQLLKSGPVLRLAKNERFRVADQQRIGGYGQPSSSSAISGYNSVSDGGERIPLEVRRDVILVRHSVLYFGDRFNNYLPASKKSLLKFLPEKQSVIKKYLDENKIDFNSQKDMYKLLAELQAGT